MFVIECSIRKMDEVRNNSFLTMGEIIVANKTKVDEIDSEIFLCNKDDFTTIKNYHFWLKGIFLFLVAFTGLILNIIAMHILSTRNSMKNAFNSLLICLFCIDTFYLLIELVSSVQTMLVTTEMNDDFITLLVPHFLYPMASVSLSGSIFMTIGVAHERYVAIKSPIKHRQSMRSTKARRHRLVKYVVLVVLCSFAVNVPKFLETEVLWVDQSVDQGQGTDARRYSKVYNR